MSSHVSVIGGGSWGTALANLLAENGCTVTMYVREDEVVDSITNKRENTTFLPGIPLNERLGVRPFDDLRSNTNNKILWAVPTQFSRSVAESYADTLADKDVIIATKGIEISTGELPLTMLEDTLRGNLSILSGPSFAKEVGMKKPTAVAVASKDEESAKWWQSAFSNAYFRVYVTDDVNGVEAGGALKNVIAIATGISDGLEFGYNARAGIITRGLAEITRLGIRLGARPETFMGLSGMGDLVLTCTGDLSRNRTFGLALAEGKTKEEVEASMKMVAEGVYTARAVHDLSARIGVDMPISEEVYSIIYEGKKPFDSVSDLMNRPLRSEGI